MGRLNESRPRKVAATAVVSGGRDFACPVCGQGSGEACAVAETPEEEVAAPRAGDPEPVTLESVNTKADAAALAGHNAWMLTSSALVLFMTAPGLAMFYGGLVRKKNVLSVIMQCLFLMA